MSLFRLVKMWRVFKRVIYLAQRKSGLLEWRFRNEPRYHNPTEKEFLQIEQELCAVGVVIKEYEPPIQDYKDFVIGQYFPMHYHGGPKGGVWDEKILEHWISSRMLGVMDYSEEDVFIDVAAAGSPWVQILRERFGVEGFAIDIMEASKAYRDLPYYFVEDATATRFADGSVKGIALHCAYEMFLGDDDKKFIEEAARILKPGGKVIILPLYMHTHYCSYSTPEYYGKGYSDPAAQEYVRLDSEGVPSSRKYNAVKLKERVLDLIVEKGMHFKLYALRNKEELGDGVYCHFILEIIR